jgi:hypothetical protein
VIKMAEKRFFNGIRMSPHVFLFGPQNVHFGSRKRQCFSGIESCDSSLPHPNG